MLSCGAPVSADAFLVLKSAPEGRHCSFAEDSYPELIGYADLGDAASGVTLLSLGQSIDTEERAHRAPSMR